MKAKLRLKTIGGKIILSIVIVIAICALFSAFIVSQVVKNQLEEKYEVDKVAATESLSYSLAPVLDLYDYKQVERIITSSLTYENIANITVFNKGGIPIVSATEQNVFLKDLDVEKYEMTSNDEVIGSINVGFSREYIDNQMQTTTIALISGLAGFLILVGLALFIFINRSVIGPIETFTETVKGIDSENLSLRVNIHSEDELGTLAGSFNQMTEDLEKSHGALQQSAEEWKTTFDSIPDLVSINDKDFRLLRVNKAFADTLSMKPEELVGKKCYQMIHRTNEPVPNCPHMKTLETKVPAITELFEPQLGLHIEVATSPIFNEKGEVVASTHITRDITQRKLAEEERLSHQKVVQELALAGRIQASFLPSDTPYVPGWQLAAALVPTKETSGDFYDYIPLPNGKLGILVADVTDKGMAAALYMALTRTLIRTYAVEYDKQPELAFSAANRRILTDTHSDLFVTVFYGIIDPVTGILTYCNAGHNPPYLLHAQNGEAVQTLRRTGVPLGVYEDETWTPGIVQLTPGDTLVLYTDGITEAQDRQEKFFGKERLLEVAQANLGRSAQEIQDAILTAVDKFVGNVTQFDDITLMVVVRGLPK